MVSQTVNVGRQLRCAAATRTRGSRISPGISAATSPGQVVIGWEDDGSLATLSPPLSILQTSFVHGGQTTFVVADEGINQIGELLNQGAGAFPATSTTFPAGNSPAGVVLGNITQHNSAINDAAVANFSGGATVITNTGTGGVFGTINHLVASPEQETAAIAEGNLDGSGVSLVVANEANNSITIFPDGSATGAVTFTTGLSLPIAVIVANFRGPGSNPDIAVLNSVGTIQFFRIPNGGTRGLQLRVGRAADQ